MSSASVTSSTHTKSPFETALSSLDSNTPNKFNEKYQNLIRCPLQRHICKLRGTDDDDCKTSYVIAQCCNVVNIAGKPLQGTEYWRNGAIFRKQTGFTSLIGND